MSVGFGTRGCSKSVWDVSVLNQLVVPFLTVITKSQCVVESNVLSDSNVTAAHQILLARVSTPFKQLRSDDAIICLFLYRFRSIVDLVKKNIPIIRSVKVSQNHARRLHTIISLLTESIYFKIVMNIIIESICEVIYKQHRQKQMEGILLKKSLFICCFYAQRCY